MAVQRKLWILCCIGAVLALMVGSGLLTARAFGPEQKVVDPGKKWPLLVEPEVLNHWGKVTVFIPVHPIEDGALEAPAFLSNWEEAYGIAIDLDSPTLAHFITLSNHSYKFTSPASAYAALQHIPTWEWLAEEPSLLNPTVVKLLERHAVAWRIWYGVDDEGFPTYDLWLQSGPYLASVYLSIAVPTFYEEFADAGPFPSEEEQAQKWGEILQNKLREGLTCKDLIDVERSRSLGQQVLYHVIQTLVEDLQ